MHRTLSTPDRRIATAVYPAEPFSAGAARRFVRQTLLSWGQTADAADVVDEAVLLTSELVTNAILHARTPVEVTCRLADGTIEVVVADERPVALVPVQPASDRPAESTHGRGLGLASALSWSWGVEYAPSFKAVWVRSTISTSGSAGRDG